MHSGDGYGWLYVLCPVFLLLHKAMGSKNYALEMLRVVVGTWSTWSPRRIGLIAHTLTVNPCGGLYKSKAFDHHQEHNNKHVEVSVHHAPTASQCAHTALTVAYGLHSILSRAVCDNHVRTHTNRVFSRPKAQNQTWIS